jgi:hypothetical protein
MSSSYWHKFPLPKPLCTSSPSQFTFCANFFRRKCDRRFFKTSFSCESICEHLPSIKSQSSLPLATVLRSLTQLCCRRRDQCRFRQGKKSSERSQKWLKSIQDAQRHYLCTAQLQYAKRIVFKSTRIEFAAFTSSKQRLLWDEDTVSFLWIISGRKSILISRQFTSYISAKAGTWSSHHKGSHLSSSLTLLAAWLLVNMQSCLLFISIYSLSSLKTNQH